MTSHAYVIGFPIGHSLSPHIHSAAFAAVGIDATLEAVAVPPEHLGEWVAEARRADVLGFCVTVPHKEAVASFLDTIEGDAQLAGAVNCVVMGEQVVGTNTDTVGFRRSLADEAGVSLAHRNVVLLGAGGAARAVSVVALQDGARSLTVANRTITRATRLIADLEPIRGSTQVDAIGLPSPDLTLALNRASVVVNATSIGLAAGDIPIDPDPIPREGLVVDIIYNPRETAFLRAATRQGNPVLGGLGMLVYQAAAAFRLWTGVEPPIDIMRKAGERALGSMS
jgi:shikimate dehydrogenase